MTSASAPAAVRRYGGPVAGLAVLAFAVAWVAYKAFGAGFGNEGNVPTFVIVTLNGLSLAGLYFIVASGFTLIFGLMRVVNMAHGSLYLFGGYIAYVAQTHWYSGGTSQFQLGPTNNIGVMGFFVPLVFATFVI